MVPIFTHYLWGCWRMKSIVKGGGLMAGAALLLSGCGSLDGKRGAGPMASPAPATTGVTDVPVMIGDPYKLGGVTYTPIDVADYDEVGYATSEESSVGKECGSL